MASLLYGAGLRLRECLHLRVKDLDYGYRQIIVRDGYYPQGYEGGVAKCKHEKLRMSCARKRAATLDLNGLAC
jgi:integrase